MQYETGSIINGREPDVSSDASGNGVDPKRDSSDGSNTGSGASFVDPDTERISNAAGIDGARRTRSGRIDRRTRAGRGDTGTTTGTEKESVHLDKIDLAEAIFGLNLTLAQLTKIEEIALEREESKDLADAIKEVGKFHAMNFDPKKVAYFNLCVVLGRLYVPRIMAVRNRKQTEAKAAPPAPRPQLVSKTNGAPAPPPVDLSKISPSALWNEGGGSSEM